MAMAIGKIVNLACKYGGLINKYGNVSPKRHDEPVDHTPEAYEHMLYMCFYLQHLCKGETDTPSSGREKIMRWFAWLQAKMHTHFLISLAEAKSDNAPSNAIFSTLGATPTIDFTGKVLSNAEEPT
jgi:hypothetical protein